MPIPSFNDGDLMSDIRVNVLNPAVATINEHELKIEEITTKTEASLKDAEVSGQILTLTKTDDSTVEVTLPVAGADGESAYEVAQNNGFTGSEEEWLESLKGPTGDPGVDVDNATIDPSGDLIISLSDGSSINAGKARGENGGIIHSLLSLNTYRNFFGVEWGILSTGIYGISGLGTDFINAPFPLNASTTYTFEILLINEPSQYSMRLIAIANADWKNLGREATLAGVTKTAAEVIGWKVVAFTSDVQKAGVRANEVLKLNSDGEIVGTGVFSSKEGSAVFGSGSINIGHHVISSAGEGVEATNTSSGESYSFVFAGQGDDTGPVHRILDSAQVDIETTSSKTVQLTNPTSRLTTLADYRVLRLPITIDAVDAQTNVTMRVFSTSGDDLWSLGPFDINPGLNTITPNTVLDFKTGQYDVEFTSPDGDVVLWGGVGAISGVDVVYMNLPTKQWSDETLSNIKQEGAIIRTVEAGTNIELSTDADGVLTISSVGDGTGSELLVNGNVTEEIVIGDGLESSYDDLTSTTTILVEPLLVDGEITKTIASGVGFNTTHDPATDEVEIGFDTAIVEVNPSDNSFFHKTQTIFETPRDPLVSTSGFQIRDGDGQVMLGSVIQENGSADPDFLAYIGDTEQSGSIQNLESTLAKFDEGRTYGFGQGAILSINQRVIDDRRHYIIGATAPDNLTLTIDEDLIGCRLLLEAFETSQFNFYEMTIVSPGGQNLVFELGRGDQWIVETSQTNATQAYKVKDGGSTVIEGLGGRLDVINETHIRPFRFAEGMPYHLLLETPTSSRLIHEFPKSKTFVFSPNATSRTYVADVIVNEVNQGVTPGDLDLGEYSDFPLYIMEPNVVINRDQRATINFPANMTIDVREGFYAFGTISGRCGNNSTNGTSNVYVGDKENSRSAFGCIGFRIASDGLYIMDGTNTVTLASGGASLMKFLRDDGITNFYRFAFYVDNSGLMTYYIVSLNDGQLSTGTHQCVLNNIPSNPKLWMTYDRLSNNTSCIAIGETHLVLNYKSDRPEGLWNWRF